MSILSLLNFTNPVVSFFCEMLVCPRSWQKSLPIFNYPSSLTITMVLITMKAILKLKDIVGSKLDKKY